MRNVHGRGFRGVVVAAGAAFAFSCASPMAERPQQSTPQPHHVVSVDGVTVTGRSEQAAPQAYNSSANPIELTQPMRDIVSSLTGSARQKSERLFSMLHRGGERGVTVVDMTGQQPRTASETLSSGGDCTDLAGLAIPMLREAGVPGGAMVVHFASAPQGVDHMVPFVTLDGRDVIFDLQAGTLGDTAQGRYTVVTRMTYEQAGSMYHREMGDYFRDHSRPDEAIRAYSRALELFDADAYVHQNLGILYERNGSMDASAREFRRAADIDPRYRREQTRGDYNTELQAGQQAAQQGRWADCVTHLRNALSSGERLRDDERRQIQSVIDQCQSRQSSISSPD
ncbi:MAG TPA: tetratricopeptide repeat protein [Candidatus Bilamarchaeum sp.]|nr:tetratricopeptide repeat protein [Candidatus Bilamarchaeum sp.]